MWEKIIAVGSYVLPFLKTAVTSFSSTVGNVVKTYWGILLYVFVLHIAFLYLHEFYHYLVDKFKGEDKDDIKSVTKAAV